ncbi:MAG: SRPBCC domain-containing protein [Sphingomonas sp.]|uniref:SRPBCC family protein n=1 Tax=Sphingomonas sp. TaxID=28214 RepID=UPI0025F65D3E|nr:SRPBCC domain-containing protein [Sphingomonas sp.]MBX3564977.1 SRPBCC domain-containing protein [Sphingomonas sp.]
MTDTRTKPVFTIQRRFAAPIERVFDAWADPKQMEQWSGPVGSQVTVLRGGIAPGETMHSHFRAADGAGMHTLVRYHEVSRPHRLVYDQSFADADANIVACPFLDPWPQVMRTEVDFVAENDGTRLTLRWTPIDASAAEEAMFASMMESMTGGWSGSFDKLDAFLAG